MGHSWQQLWLWLENPKEEEEEEINPEGTLGNKERIFFLSVKEFESHTHAQYMAGTGGGLQVLLPNSMLPRQFGGYPPAAKS